MNDETYGALEDLLIAFSRPRSQGYAVSYSDAIYLVHADRTVELEQEPYHGGFGVRILGYKIHEEKK